MTKVFISILGIFFMLTTAQGLEVKDPNRIILEVKGVVCSFCAFGLSKKLSKLDFVDTDVFEKGVHTDIKKGHVTLAIDSQKPIRLRAIQKKIKKGGYELRGIHLLLKGGVSTAENRVTMENTPSGQIFELLDLDGKPWTEAPQSEEQTLIQGYIPYSYLSKVKSKKPIPVQVKTATQ